MKRNPNTKSHASAAAMLSAGALLVPGLPAAAQGVSKPLPPGQKSVAESKVALPVFKFAAKFDKWHGTLIVVGLLKERPVFKTAQGEYFQVDPNTGDLKFLSPESLGYLKIGGAPVKNDAAKMPGFLKLAGFKYDQPVSVLGVDGQGHVIHQNTRGERFYLNPKGDMVFIK